MQCVVSKSFDQSALLILLFKFEFQCIYKCELKHNFWLILLGQQIVCVLFVVLMQNWHQNVHYHLVQLIDMIYCEVNDLLMCNNDHCSLWVHTLEFLWWIWMRWFWICRKFCFPCREASCAFHDEIFGVVKVLTKSKSWCKFQVVSWRSNRQTWNQAKNQKVTYPETTR